MLALLKEKSQAAAVHMQAAQAAAPIASKPKATAHVHTMMQKHKRFFGTRSVGSAVAHSVTPAGRT